MCSCSCLPQSREHQPVIPIAGISTQLLTQQLLMVIIEGTHAGAIDNRLELSRPRVGIVDGGGNGAAVIDAIEFASREPVPIGGCSSARPLPCDHIFPRGVIVDVVVSDDFVRHVGFRFKRTGVCIVCPNCLVGVCWSAGIAAPRPQFRLLTVFIVLPMNPQGAGARLVDDLVAEIVRIRYGGSRRFGVASRRAHSAGGIIGQSGKQYLSVLSIPSVDMLNLCRAGLVRLARHYPARIGRTGPAAQCVVGVTKRQSRGYVDVGSVVELLFNNQKPSRKNLYSARAIEVFANNRACLRR
jgi:hypothetical protein